MFLQVYWDSLSLTLIFKVIKLSIEDLTCASHSISAVALIAGTSEGPRCVGTLSIAITRRLFHTFINICAKQHAWRYFTATVLLQVYWDSLSLTLIFKVSKLSIEVLTCASHSVSAVAIIAATSEGPRCVGTHSIAITRRLFHTFINICAKQQAWRYFTATVLLQVYWNSLSLTLIFKVSKLSIEVLTCASHSVSAVAIIAGTSEGPRCVGTHSIAITRRLFHTFINICAKQQAWRYFTATVLLQVYWDSVKLW